MEEIIYLEFNNWFGGRDYPMTPKIERLIRGCERGSFLFNDQWCKEQKICVKVGNIDMSCHFCITAPKSWVEENCPECLTDDEYDVNFIIYDNNGPHGKTEHYSYSRFRREAQNGDDTVYGRFGWTFLEYKEENFGSVWYDEIEEENA